MQTPGRQTQPQTPMIPIGRRMEGGLDRMLQRATEGAKDIERPRVLSLGKVISQLDTIGGGMREMRNQIRNDIKVKQQFYREESKILKKDSENLEGINLKLLRGALGGITAGVAVSQFAGGDIKGGLTTAGIASLLLAPEIIDVISGGVVQSLALKGLIGGGKGAPVAGLGQNLGGVSKFKNPLLITAALAASLLFPSLARGQDNSDKRRQELTRKTIGGREVINRGDVSRFRGQLTRFEGILDKMKVDKESKEDKRIVDFKKGEPVDLDKNLPKEMTKNQALDFFDIMYNKNERKEGKNQWWDFFDVFRNPRMKDGDSIKNVGKEIGKVNNEISMEVDNSTKEENKITNENVDVATKFITENQNFFGDEITETFEPNIDLREALAKLDIGEITSEIKKSSTQSSTTNNVIDLTQKQETQKTPKFSGISAIPSSVFVSTKFNSSGGAIDKFESASSLRTYGAFS